jgi:hypothetical protein
LIPAIRRSGIDLRPVEVEPGLLDRSRLLLDRRLVREILLDRGVELLLAHGALGGERSIPRDVLLGLHELRLRLREVADRLVVGGLELARVDLEEEMTRLHDAAVPVVLREHVARHLGPDLRGDVTVDGTYPFRVGRDVALLDGAEQDLGGGRAGASAFFPQASAADPTSTAAKAQRSRRAAAPDRPFINIRPIVCCPLPARRPEYPGRGIIEQVRADARKKRSRGEGALASPVVEGRALPPREDVPLERAHLRVVGCERRTGHGVARCTS